ncbi:molybdopterin cofactor-binding domain-containing protein [Thalassomonas sp. RHCl1]|uniref:xanthine dehydrogenase family protein molybdopterin-binding subunit n=1 Tax=Thalassomonas sp. RHCl1 TaxID=2995320 RepID=UPI00248ABD51|nr:molybdopterin cofactor-binding domain-containing protein [Thalassomonas sp. RHCl1]
MSKQKNEQQNEIDASRRRFMIGSVGTSLLMAFGGVSGLVNSPSAQALLASKSFSPNVWIEMNSEGEVLVNIAKAEMGQHVGTAFARIVCDELGADWYSVRIRHVDTDPKWGFMVTGGSWSVFQNFKMLSQAGAAGRIALIEAGAKMLGVSPESCDTEQGFVISGDKKVSFSEIIQRGKFDKILTPEEIKNLPLKPVKQLKLVGKKSQALDIPAKTDGSAKYGIDVEVPGMVYARPIVPPTRYGSKVIEVKDQAAKGIAGYLGYEIITDPSDMIQGWVIVLGETYAAAMNAVKAISVSYQKGPTAAVSEEDIQQEGTRLVNDKNQGVLFVDEGDVGAVTDLTETHLTSTYKTASAIHFQLEPLNATVEFIDGVCHVHSGNQWQSLTLPAVAKALGLPAEKVVIHQYYLGGGFGRRLFGDYMLPAALVAQKISKPVKLIFTREDDSIFSQPRSPSVQRFDAAFDGKNALLSVEHALTAGWPTLSMAPGFMPDSLDKKGKIDPFSTSGADHWYSIENHRVRAINNDLAQRTFLPGWLRSVGPGWIGWGVESFMDEIAHQSKQDPLAFRLNLLDGKGKNKAGAERLAHTLKQAKEASGWGEKLAADEGMGVAVCAGQERTMPTWISCVAKVKVNRGTGEVTLKKLTLVVDCGLVVHPDGALAQLEGSVLWGVSLALHEGNAFKEGKISATNLNSYSPLRMNDVPELDIRFVESEEAPVGLGEPGVIAVAPAIGNAIFDAVGVRVRDLPIRADEVKRLLNS